MSLLGIEEVLKYAVRIEEKGEAFYLQWARQTENENQKKFFNFMADEEKDHKKTFERMSKELETVDSQPEGIDNQEYEHHLKKVSEEILFNEKNYEKEMKMVSDLSSAVEFALKQELDTVLFFTDLKVFLSREHLEIMDKIIEEERNHCTKLEEFKEKLLEYGLK